MGTMCYNVVQFFMVIFNFVFWLLGLAIVGLAVWMLVDPSFYISMAQDSNHYYISVYIMLAIGIQLVIVAFLGCCGSLRESQCMLISFFCLLLIILVAQIASAVWVYTNAERLEPLIKSTMRITVQEEYHTVESRRTSFDVIQRSLECCGADRPSDWIRHKTVSLGISTDTSHYNIPQSCCRNGIGTQACEDATKVLKVGGVIDTNVIFSEGCIDKVVQVLQSHAYIIIIVAFAVMIVESVGLLFSLILMVSINRSGRYKA